MATLRLKSWNARCILEFEREYENHIRLERPEYLPVLSADEEQPEYVLKKLQHSLPTTQSVPSFDQTSLKARIISRHIENHI